MLPKPRLTDLIGWIASYVCVPAIALVVATDVLFRYLLNAPIHWAQDVTSLALLLFFFAGQPLCVKQDGHIRVELLMRWFPRGLRTLAEVVSQLFAILIAGLLGYRLVVEAFDPYSRNDAFGFVEIPLFPFRMLLALFMLVMVVECLRRILAAMRDVSAD